MLFGLAPARPETTPRGQASVAEAPPATRFLLEGSMYQVQMTCACGEKYWPTQKWIHKECGVVNPPQTVTTATNNMANTDLANGISVANTYKYRDPEKRRAYQREYMRKIRAKV
jgi:hypothetical protein